MIQNIIVLMIVFTTVAYIIYGIVRSFKIKKTCNCDGCSGCDLKAIVKAKELRTLKIVKNK